MAKCSEHETAALAKELVGSFPGHPPLSPARYVKEVGDLLMEYDIAVAMPVMKRIKLEMRELPTLSAIKSALDAEGAEHKQRLDYETNRTAITVLNFWNEAIAYGVAHHKKNAWPKLTKDTHQLALWFEYFHRHLNWLPVSFKNFILDYQPEFTVPEIDPCVFDKGFLPVMSGYDWRTEMDAIRAQHELETRGPPEISREQRKRNVSRLGQLLRTLGFPWGGKWPISSPLKPQKTGPNETERQAFEKLCQEKGVDPNSVRSR